MKRHISLTDHTALSFLSEDPRGHLTFRIANACGLGGGRANRTPSQAYTMLRRLERWGYVERRSTGPGCYALWAITEAGRKAVQP